MEESVFVLFRIRQHLQWRPFACMTVMGRTPYQLETSTSSRAGPRHRQALPFVLTRGVLLVPELSAVHQTDQTDRSQFSLASKKTPLETCHAFPSPHGKHVFFMAEEHASDCAT